MEEGWGGAGVIFVVINAFSPSSSQKKRLVAAAGGGEKMRGGCYNFRAKPVRRDLGN